MHRYTIIAATLAFGAGFAGAAFAAAPPASAPGAAAPAKPAAAKPAGPSDKAQIEALERSFIAAFNAKDVAKIMSHYSKRELFVFDVVPPRQYVGWDAYEKDWEELFKAFPGPVKASMADLSVTVAGTVAYGHNIQTSTFAGADGGKTELTVRVSDVYRKVGGRWLIVQEHVSIPVDLATMKPDPTSKP
jgi:ketosteroid isomerase-like protein